MVLHTGSSGSWRLLNHNSRIDTGSDLTEFMFGSERSQLGGVREALLDTGPARCFYSGKGLSD